LPVEHPVYEVRHERLPKSSYILCMPPAQKIIYDPLVCGLELRKFSLECSKRFLRTAWNLIPSFRKARGRRISELIVLRGGLGYQFSAAFEQEFGRYLSQCFVGARRYRISGGEFGADIFYSNFDALPNRGLLFTGDTIATGISLSQTLSVTRSELRKRDYDIKALIVFTIAGSFKGCSRLVEWEERFREWWPSFRIHVFASEAFFGLAANGTDLLFRQEGGVIIPEESMERVSRIYGDYESGYLPGRICAIFDWGDRNFKPERHLEDVIKFSREHLRLTKERKARELLVSFIQGAMQKLREFGSPLALRK
jgi:hypothetical protein